MHISTLRGTTYDRIVQEARTPRTTPRPNGCMSDPAPDWYWKLVRTVLRRSGHVKDEGEALARRAIAWCRQENTEPRSAALIALLEQPGRERPHPKRPRVDDLVEFLESVGG